MSPPHSAEIVEHPALKVLREAEAPQANALAPILKRLGYRHGAVTAGFRGFSLSSVFQPIYSFSHQRPVGAEALVRASDDQGRNIPPPLMFGAVKRVKDSVFLDRLCRAMHVANFQALDNRAWLFLNVNPMVVVNGPKSGAFFRDLLDHFNMPPHQIVVEILETAIPSEHVLEETVAYYKDFGCMVAVDDFGAGHSNFERIWRLKPDIVKLDRKMLTEATCRDVIRRSLPNLVALLHEAGCIVLAEGIETDDEALIAMDASVDLAQGYLFARPSPISDPAPIQLEAGHRVHELFKSKCIAEAARRHDAMAPFLGAFERVAREIGEGADPSTVVDELLRLEGALRFYVIDQEGLQSLHNFVPVLDPRPIDKRLAPISEAKGASWYHRAYFRKALARPGELHVTGPYLSLPDAMMCTTLSKAVPCGDKLAILCFDVCSRQAGHY